MPYNSPTITFVETSLFTRIVYDYLTEDEYAELQGFLAAYPDAGAVVPGSGGVRKLRWGMRDRGKRGSLRVIYYLQTQAGEIWMLTLYSKAHQENIPAHVFRAIKEAIEHDNR
ncbi:MAG: transcriptional regulator [Chloroflexi bacterium HGW-Chloroflexi-1]|nr:MAG: transcriptional regulator [Chloroflexi bacterium HGW-Chloroflexi-1]